MSDEDPYTLRQDREDARYAKEYQAWIASLSPEERRKVASMGIDKPDLARSSNGVGLSRDAAESYSAKCYDDEPEQDAAESESTTINSDQIWDIMRRLIGELASDKNPGLTMDCATLVAGLAYQGNSMTDIAKRHGITRAAVSKRCIEMTDALKIKPYRAMRSGHARKAYQQARILSVQKQKLEIHGH
jgi:hypothetical protein